MRVPDLDNLLLEASDPTTSGERLAQLALRPEAAGLVALNPNAPAALLHELGARWPGLVQKNPAFLLLLLDDPALSRAPPDLQCALARCPETPEDLLLQLFTHAPLRAELARNPALPEALLERILDQADEQIRTEVVRGSIASPAIRRRLLSDGSPRVRQLARKLAPDSGFSSLLRRAERLGREGVHERPLSLEEQRTLLAGGVWARVLLLRQRSRHREIDEALAVDPSPVVQRQRRRAAPQREARRG